MSHPNSRNGSAIFEGEDNSPFPQSQIGEMASTENSPPAQEGALEEGKTVLENDSISVDKLANDPRESSCLIQSLNAHERLPPNEDKLPDTDDPDSLLLFSSERENYNAVNINHESRVVKILSSDSPVEVQISEAGKSNEGMANSLKKYIVYTIKLIKIDGAKEEIQTRRRYSDFESLRDILNRIFPLVVIPPIPPKNYFALNVWNGLVGNNNGHGSTSGTQDSSHLENGSLAGGLNAYSYINSKHLNKSRLIEHRKRLLANFLNNCLQMKKIRNLSFFAKFLDPSANWSDEVALVQSQLPKLIYLLNPENGLKTEKIYAELPLPIANNALGLSFLKANKLAQKTSQLLGSATSDIVSATSSKPETTENEDAENGANADGHVLHPSQLDAINKKIMGNLMGLSNDYVELGVALNLILLGVAEPSKAKINKDSDLDDNTKLDFIFDKIGMAFDRSYLTLNSLMGEVETKFSEPLGETVQYNIILSSVKKFQSRKIKQQNLIDSELKEKRKELADKMRMELGNHQDVPASRAPQEPKTTSGFISKMSSFKAITNYVSTIIDQSPKLTRKEKIAQLHKRIAILDQCQKIMLEDIAYVTCEVDKNYEAFKEKEFCTILQILRSYNGVFVSWAKKNLEIWEEIKEEIEKTQF